mmetsp:Transcript_50028/g.131612  ORF Transcript_50028/g.131612 Transcript_50028/m.131612 type:complete len:102 (-) Transcript_50028:517-822(-)
MQLKKWRTSESLRSGFELATRRLCSAEDSIKAFLYYFLLVSVGAVGALCVFILIIVGSTRQFGLGFRRSYRVFALDISSSFSLAVALSTSEFIMPALIWSV